MHYSDAMQAMQATFPAGRYLGAIQAQVCLDDLVLSELRYDQETTVLEHAHENAFLFFVLDGTEVEVFQASRRFHRKGTLTLHPPQEPHRHEIGPSGVRSLNVEFGASWLAAHPYVWSALQKPAHIDTHRFPSMAVTAETLFREFSDLDDVSPLAIEGAVLSLLAVVGRTHSMMIKAKPHWLKKLAISCTIVTPSLSHSKHLAHLWECIQAIWRASFTKSIDGPWQSIYGGCASIPLARPFEILTCLLPKLLSIPDLLTRRTSHGFSKGSLA